MNEIINGKERTITMIKKKKRKKKENACKCIKYIYCEQLRFYT